MSWGKAALWGFGIAAGVVLVIVVLVIVGSMFPPSVGVPLVLFLAFGAAITTGVYVGNNIKI
jgi:hypothetical protein